MPFMKPVEDWAWQVVVRHIVGDPELTGSQTASPLAWPVRRDFLELLVGAFCKVTQLTGFAV